MTHTHALVLITNPEQHPLTSSLLTDVKQRMKSAISDKITETWLAEGEACELGADVTDMAMLRLNVSMTLADLPVDWALLPAEGRKKKLLVCDMDSTIIGQECIDELADMAGIKAEVAAITEQAMRGELVFEEALTHRVSLLEGLEEAALETAHKERIRLNPGARTLVQTMKAHGAHTMLVSGGFTFFTERVAETAGFDSQQANRLEIDGGKLTGRVIPPILGRDAKRDALMGAAKEHWLNPSETLAAGDGANDLAMLKEAGLGVAYHAKEVVRREADVAITHTDLTALLYLQGYKKEVFIQE